MRFERKTSFTENASRVDGLWARLVARLAASSEYLFRGSVSSPVLEGACHLSMSSDDPGLQTPLGGRVGIGCLPKLGEIEGVGRVPFLSSGYREHVIDHPFEQLDDFPRGKRIADVALVIVTMPVWLPLMAGVALWIKMVSDGPVFFRQKRIGYGERQFMILKFRSMDAGADTEVHEKHVLDLMRSGQPLTKLDLQGDSRLIRGGFLLRALGLDELPQLINVLLGEMSLVGPRPCTSRELSQYSLAQRERFLAHPGLTGYWQVNGKNRTTFAEMVALDIDYRRHRSALLDLAIIVQTGPALLMQLAEASAGLTTQSTQENGLLRDGGSAEIFVEDTVQQGSRLEEPTEQVLGSV